MSYLGYTNPFYHVGRIMRGYLPSPSTGEGRRFRSDFLEEIRPEDAKALIVGVRIEQPRGRRDTAQ